MSNYHANGLMGSDLTDVQMGLDQTKYLMTGGAASGDNWFLKNDILNYRCVFGPDMTLSDVLSFICNLRKLVLTTVILPPAWGTQGPFWRAWVRFRFARFAAWEVLEARLYAQARCFSSFCSESRGPNRLWDPLRAHPGQAGPQGAQKTASGCSTAVQKRFKGAQRIDKGCPRHPKGCHRKGARGHLSGSQRVSKNSPYIYIYIYSI